jgi:G3E family GTPase
MTEGRSAPRTPVSIITGFLGSGKTTLLQGLLREPSMAETAVIINEFGAVGLDHLLVREITTEILLLESGCLCCAVRDDLVDTLRDLSDRRAKGELPPFRRVIVETSGLANPAPIARTVLMTPYLRPRYAMERMVTTVDAALGLGELAEFVEATVQVALADRIVLTKSDLADARTMSLLRHNLHVLNAAAPVLTPAAPGAIDPALLFGGDELVHLSDASPASAQTLHTHGVNSFTLSVEGRLDWDVFLGWLDGLLALHGRDLLRLKAVLHLAERTRPVLVQAVQHLLFAPIEINEWPLKLNQSVLVFVTRELSGSDIAASLQSALEAQVWVGQPSKSIDKLT